jgi:hypothetical protein
VPDLLTPEEIQKREWRRLRLGGGGGGTTAATMTPTTSSPWTPKVRCNFTRSPSRSPALGVLDAADATKSNNCCCGDAFCRTRGAGPVAGGEAGAAEPPLEGAFQIPDSFGLALWEERPSVGAGLWSVSRFGDFVLTSPTVLRSASSRGSS